MIKRKFRQGSAILLAAVLAFSGFAITKSYAAGLVDLEQTCSIQINVPEEGFSELKSLEIPVNLYKVADIDVTGNYTTVDAFADVDLSGLSSETTAEEWAAIAAAAKAEVDDEEAPITADHDTVIAEGTAAVTEIPVGLYLVDAQEVHSAIYKYTFTPYMISLPNNYYYTDEQTDDSWVYELTGDKAVGLKPAKEDLFGNLKINKTLDVFNGTYTSATFVFQVEGTKVDPDAPEGTEPAVVISDVFALEFTGPDTKSLVVGPIPAGAEVVVTEIYSGASYKLTTDAEQTTTIISDEMLAEDPELGMAEVSFGNTHDDRPNGGNGIVNSFSYDGGQWTYEASGDSLTTP